MAKPKNIIKFETESTKGTTVDVSQHIKGVTFSGPIESVSFWRHPILWIKERIAIYKLRRLVKFPDITLSIHSVYTEEPDAEERRMNNYRYN